MHKFDRDQQQEIRRHVILTHPQLNLSNDFQFEYINLSYLDAQLGKHPYSNGSEAVLMSKIRDYVTMRCFDGQEEPIPSKHLHLVVDVGLLPIHVVANARMRLDQDYFDACGIGSITLIDTRSSGYVSAVEAYAATLPALRAMTGQSWRDSEGSYLGEMAIAESFKALLVTLDDRERQLVLKDNEIAGLRSALQKKQQ